ncbi:hypothetical protein ACIBG8_07300 [Nonomuraea sp. NPDC050556]
MDRLPKLREQIEELARTIVTIINAVSYFVAIALITIAGIITLWQLPF